MRRDFEAGLRWGPPLLLGLVLNPPAEALTEFNKVVSENPNLPDAEGNVARLERDRAIDDVIAEESHGLKTLLTRALENHGGIVATVDQLLYIVKAVKSDWFGVNLDTGNFRGADPYAELAQLADDLVGELLVAVKALGHRLDLALGEVADGAADQLVVVGEVEVHARESTE